MNAYVTSLVRVGAAALVAALAGLLAHANIHLGTSATGAITVAVVAVCAPIALGMVTALERRFPWLRRVLPVKGTPAK